MICILHRPCPFHRVSLCWKNVQLLSHIIHLLRVSKRTLIHLLSFHVYLISRIFLDCRILYLRDIFVCLSRFLHLSTIGQCVPFSIRQWFYDRAAQPKSIGRCVSRFGGQSSVYHRTRATRPTTCQLPPSFSLQSTWNYNPRKTSQLRPVRPSAQRLPSAMPANEEKEHAKSNGKTNASSF